MSNCEHDYENPVRKGRAHYVCCKCGADITMALLYLAEAEQQSYHEPENSDA